MPDYSEFLKSFAYGAVGRNYDYEMARQRQMEEEARLAREREARLQAEAAMRYEQVQSELENETRSRAAEDAEQVCADGLWSVKLAGGGPLTYVGPVGAP